MPILLLYRLWVSLHQLIARCSGNKSVLRNSSPTLIRYILCCNPNGIILSGGLQVYAKDAPRHAGLFEPESHLGICYGMQ
jgi:GMP synthase-like glutamine amidotransferase